ncbi:MAG: hypothetical protein OXB84_04270 [Halobacteriovoraceae bacterium]|nr:hypothetical protein [Halobacteriovoraceae bacterium]
MEENHPILENREKATALVKKLYDNYYKENIEDSSFSERSFARKAEVSQSLLNTLRNGDRKEINAENAVKILVGIKKEEYINPVLSVLSPTTKRLYEESKKNILKHSVQTEDGDVNKIAKLSYTKTYGHILAIVMIGMEHEDTTVEHINNISPDGELLLNNLIEMGVLEIVKNNIVRPTEKIRSFFKNKKMYLDLPETAEYAKMLLDNVFNAHLVEKNKEAGGCTVITGRYSLEKISKILSKIEDLMKYIYEPEEDLREEHLKMAWTFMGTSLYDPRKYKKSIKQDGVKETIQ